MLGPFQEDTHASDPAYAIQFNIYATLLLIVGLTLLTRGESMVSMSNPHRMDFPQFN